MQKSFLAKNETFEPEWVLVDADNQSVGRLATQIAMMLMGKHRPTYTPHVCTGDHVVVINADRVRFGSDRIVHPNIPNFTHKATKKEYWRWSGYPGGLKIIPAEEMLARKPEEVLKLAVRRMLPKTRLAKRMLERLRIYRGPTHPHQAQGPTPLDLKT